MNVQLMLGDCLELMRELPDGCIDAVITDPPYGLTNNEWDVMPDLTAWWEQAHRVCKGAIVMTASQPFAALVIVSNIKRFKHEWIWHKSTGSNFMNVCREPFKEHESVLVFSEGKWIYNAQREARRGDGEARSRRGDGMLDKNSTNYGAISLREPSVRTPDRLPSSVQPFNVERGLHPNQKPVTLFSYLVQTYTNEGDTVLDCYAGSGTAAIACIKNKRRFIGYESDADYFAIAQRRIEAAQAQGILKLEDSE